MEFKHKYFAYFAAFIISTLVMNANIFMKKCVEKSKVTRWKILTLGTSPLKLGCSHDSIGVDTIEMPGQ